MSSSTPQQQLIAYIHHERQEPGSMLCAQHALNALLQGQYYDASQLAQIATELDQLEASELGLSQADIAARDRSSLNMDDTGFFSASVLERALQVWGISISSWRSASMRQRHDTPEREAAFVLNLNSHWFTIRSFGTTSKFWYNLNSFLPEPQWIGNNYLGTLLHTAEAEGYSVFVVQASEGSAGQALRESDADQIADHLPPPGASSASTESASASLGLRPGTDSKSSTALPPAATSSGLGGRGVGDDEEDAELQAALSASLAQHTLSAPGTPSRSRVRQVRSGSSEGVAGGDSSMGETDADIDAIAPSRRRHRAGYVDPVDDDLRRAMEASLSSTSSQPSRASSAAHVPGAAAESSSSASTSSRPVGRRKRRAQERQSGLSRDDAIDLDDSRGDDTLSSDIEELRPSSLSHRSPFLSPAMAAANRNNEDVEEIVDDDDDYEDIPSDDEVVDPFSIRGAPEASALIGPRQDRHYDDEDAELQAALAASLGDTEAATRFAAENPNYRAPARASEEQVAIPEDVDRIYKMREEARRKAREEEEKQERRARGEVVQDEESAAGTSGAGAGEAAKDADDDEDEESDAEEVSAEEMRRRRLARFG